MPPDSPRLADISFEPLCLQDIPLLYLWLAEPHVREFYAPAPRSREAIFQKYAARTEPTCATKAFVIRVATPIGYIQVYPLSDWPEYAALVGESNGVSVDLFIGEAGYLGRGWGRRILIKFLHEVAFPIFPGEKLCWISHDVPNTRARQASRAAGFRRTRTIMENGRRMELLVIARSRAKLMALKLGDR